MAGALLLGFVTGGLIEGVAECALWSLCDFGEAILTSEIDAALTLQLPRQRTGKNVRLLYGFDLIPSELMMRTNDG